MFFNFGVICKERGSVLRVKGIGVIVVGCRRFVVFLFLDSVSLKI